MRYVVLVQKKDMLVIGRSDQTRANQQLGGKVEGVARFFFDRMRDAFVARWTGLAAQVKFL